MKVYSNKDNNRKHRKIMASTDYESLKADYTYDVYDHLSPEDCLDGFVEYYYQSNDYIGDAIGEHADSCVDLYNQSLCESCWDIYMSGAYDEAYANGLLEGADDLMRLLQACQYEFYSGVLYENLDAVMQNIVLNYLKYEGIDVTDEQWENICADVLTDVDNNDRISDVCEKVADIIKGDTDTDEEE